MTTALLIVMGALTFGVLVWRVGAEAERQMREDRDRDQAVRELSQQTRHRTCPDLAHKEAPARLTTARRLSHRGEVDEHHPF